MRHRILVMPKHDWEKFRAEIECLYITKDKALADVLKILAETRGLRARLALDSIADLCARDASR